MEKIFLIAARELRQRTASRGFRVATAITMLAAIGYVVVPHVLASRSAESKVVATVGSPSALEKGAFEEAAKASGISVEFRSYQSLSAAKKAISSGKAYVAYDPSSGLVVKRVAIGDQATAYADSVAQSLGAAVALKDAGLTATQLQAITHPQVPPVTGISTQSEASAANTRSAAVASIIIYVLLSQYGAWVMLGVVEEKSSRVVEVLLSSVTPRQLLTGKIVGIGVVALFHAAALVAALFGGLLVIGSSPSNSLSGGLIWLAPLWFIIGYAFYCTLFAAVGSTVSRTEDAQAATFPVAIPMLVGYVVALFGLSGSFSDGFLRVLSLIPGISPFLVPALYAVGRISVTEVVLSAAISLAATYVLVAIAARIYEASILRIGARVSWKEAASGFFSRGNRSAHEGAG